jgi:hypothetical protein
MNPYTRGKVLFVLSILATGVIGFLDMIFGGRFYNFLEDSFGRSAAPLIFFGIGGTLVAIIWRSSAKKIERESRSSIRPRLERIVKATLANALKRTRYNVNEAKITLDDVPHKEMKHMEEFQMAHSFSKEVLRKLKRHLADKKIPAKDLESLVDKFIHETLYSPTSDILFTNYINQV